MCVCEERTAADTTPKGDGILLWGCVNEKGYKVREKNLPLGLLCCPPRALGGRIMARGR
jgi:hypothetical protein